MRLLCGGARPPIPLASLDFFAASEPHSNRRRSGADCIQAGRSWEAVRILAGLRARVNRGRHGAASRRSRADPSMAVYTDVSFEELETLLADYDLGVPLSFKGIAEGVENSNFALSTDKSAFILTLYEKRVRE